MDETTFLRRIREVDQELREAGYKVFQRPLNAYFRMSDGYEGPLMGPEVVTSDVPPYEGPGLLKRIQRWYEEMYGDRINMPVVGRTPLIVGGELYLARIPIVYGQIKLNPLEFIEGVTPRALCSLPMEHLRDVANQWAEALELIYTINTLRQVQTSPATAQNLIDKAIEDYEAAVECLSNFDAPKTNACCFHAQQHAEKMMKALLVARAGKTTQELRHLGHRILELFDACRNVSSEFEAVRSHAHLVSNIRMDIRYETPTVPVTVAVETYYAGLRLGGLCASILAGGSAGARAREVEARGY